MMELRCVCDDYKENMPLLTQHAVFLLVHGQGEYKGKEFFFCPWCGQRLRESVRECSTTFLADRYDQEAIIVSQEKLDALYNDDYFEAMELENELP